MLLGAEWRPHMMCFVKQTKHPPTEEDGFIWPSPTFEFFDREGRPIEGPRKQDLHKLCVPPKIKQYGGGVGGGKSVFSHQLIDRKISKSMATATALDEMTRKAADAMAKQIDDHLLDAIMYGMGTMKIEPPKEAISFRSLALDLKVMRPGLGVYKIPDA